MFSGKVSPEAVLKAAGSEPGAVFYAHLYVGLWYEAQGKNDESLRHIRIAAEAKYAERGGYMHDVARVHAGLREGPFPARR